jgi:hypothetical protein
MWRVENVNWRVESGVESGEGRVETGNKKKRIRDKAGHELDAV